MESHRATYRTDLGVGWLVFTGDQLVAILLPGSEPPADVATAEPPPPIAARIESLEAFYEGRATFLPDDGLIHAAATTELLGEIYHIVSAIRPGHTRTYAEVAAMAGRPRASRAVGAAMARNPFPPVIPCHRVVGSDGGLHGYAGGLDMKARLLEMEGAGHQPVLAGLGPGTMRRDELEEHPDDDQAPIEVAPVEPHVVVITGMSGAGRSHAANVLEDVGYFVVDNLPPDLIWDVVEHVGLVGERASLLAVVVDTRHGLSFEDLRLALLRLGQAGIPTTLLFLDATDRALIARYQEQRRPHPVPAATLGESITLERAALEDLRGEADVIIDTTDSSVHDLRSRIEAAFAEGAVRRAMRIEITSFGFKRGVPRVVDLLFDVRFLPNPHWVEELRPLTGRDDPVRTYVLGQEDAAAFLDQTITMLEFLVPRYEAEGKSYLAIGVGCTGGNHRSVAIAEEIASRLRAAGIGVNVRHRDVGT